MRLNDMHIFPASMSCLGEVSGQKGLDSQFDPVEGSKHGGSHDVRRVSRVMHFMRIMYFEELCGRGFYSLERADHP